MIQASRACPWSLSCVECGATYRGDELRYRCDCHGTLDVVHEYRRDGIEPPGFAQLDQRRASKLPEDRSGVWRFREFVLPLSCGAIVTRGEGNTNLYNSPQLARWVGLDQILLKHEGENPTGSFKDRGMTAGVSMAKSLGMTRVACASTGNTSASMASYASVAGMRAFVFIPAGHIAYGKLSQALAYGARTIQIAGDFDAAMEIVERVCAERGIYLLNSLNPFRIEGQKATGIELLQDLDWQVPDWLVLPGGNLGNSSAIFKGLHELQQLGRIRKLPRFAIIQAAGANPLYTAYRTGQPLAPVVPHTLATAIRIGNPVSGHKAMRAVRLSDGLVEEVTDQQILDAKAQVDAAGIGAEPASCATVAGIKKLVAAGVIKPGELVCGVLTGHLLKDPDAVVHYHQGTLAGIASTYANAPVSSQASLEAVLEAMGEPDDVGDLG